jgi:exodeoxyribonuclease (lambda-induced)
MIIHEMQQGSEDWHAIRIGKVTGTSASKVTGSSWLDYTDVIAAEQITGIRNASNFKSDAMKRGLEMEPIIRDKYAELSGFTIREVGFIQPEQFPYFGMSPDGLCYSNGGLVGVVEFKCPEPQTHIRYIRENVFPPEYKSQGVSALACSQEILFVDLVSYCPEILNKPIWRIRMTQTKNLSQIAHLNGGLTVFFRQVEKTIELINF